MKKIIPILLFITICISHLKVIDAFVHFNIRHIDDNIQMAGDYPDEEQKTEKEAKEKTGETEKYWYGNGNNTHDFYNLAGQNRFFSYKSFLKKKPYNEEDFQPPKTA